MQVKTKHRGSTLKGLEAEVHRGLLKNYQDVIKMLSQFEIEIRTEDEHHITGKVDLPTAKSFY